MTDHLTAATLAASIGNDALAVDHIARHLDAAGSPATKLLREFPITLPALLTNRPTLHAAVMREAVRARWHPYASREEYDAAVERAAGILSGAIDVPRERRIAAVARARQCLASGDVAAAVGVLLDHMEAML